MRLPTPDELQSFKDRNPHLKIKITPKGVKIEPRRKQALLEAAPADIQKRTLRANAFMALRFGTLRRQQREEAEAKKNAAAQVSPIVPIDEAAITAAVTEHAAKLANQQ